MDFRILGPLEVEADGRLLPIGSRQPRAVRADRSARQHRVGNPVLGAGMADQEHRQQHDHVGGEHRHHRLPGRHAALDQARRQHIGGNADHHADPQGGKVIPAPGALGGPGRRQVVVPEVGVCGGVHAHRVFLHHDVGWAGRKVRWTFLRPREWPHDATIRVGTVCPPYALTSALGLRGSLVQFMYGRPVGCGTIGMQSSTGQVISHRLQPTHSDGLTS